MYYDFRRNEIVCVVAQSLIYKKKYKYFVFLDGREMHILHLRGFQNDALELFKDDESTELQDSWNIRIFRNA